MNNNQNTTSTGTTRPISEIIYVTGYARTGFKPYHEMVNIHQAFVSVEAAKSAMELVFPRIEWREIVDKRLMAIELDVEESELKRIDLTDIKEKGADARLWTVHYGYPLGFQLERSSETIAIVKAIPLKEWWENRVWQTSSLFDPQKETQRLRESWIKQAQDLKKVENLIPDLQFAIRLFENIDAKGEVKTLIELALKTLKPYLSPDKNIKGDAPHEAL